ncbi:protein PLANT CADMIUM RESISTANCE 10 [Andrographis paniculata]|uniref:protein PLANT CADMIUM RESISTANCE 10 n=1 Tax=Andrographis paniculata TaxID=175694 RepID=UPI0021E8B9B7|nr:protein PLANT CADMIUM RESISTANCE 10 [Andrographis paniculata]XP_051138942.1 protein PLANT CADMIUM RESISTANCE 10 [Andrographis paniculata]XP_051138943.1 protein PLANT CADMIUM RESISTANCE 10 [Andrographis paniculata]XP_051138944.1 protein PLANT CADMIUM RESISTANCE 10 [Andrographis paniculata]
MVGHITYTPPPYMPLGQSDAETDAAQSPADATSTALNIRPEQWSSGICACFDDMQSCYVGLFCPCYLFAKNAESLGSGTLVGSCAMHFILWAFLNTFCCLFTEGFTLGIPGCFAAFYACGYRRTLRTKYNLPEAPCGDFVTHFFCHLCAICQEYREIRERFRDSNSGLNLVQVTAPAMQTMESTSGK